MLLRRLFARDTPGPDTDLAFRSRGAEVSRLEGFSDAVFGFAITLLVISSKAPDNATELMAMSRAVIPFIGSFTVLFLLWRAQFDFFRRFGLEDRRTIRLTGVLLGIVLLAVYPVRFLFTAIFAMATAILAGNDSMKQVVSLMDVPKVLLLYSLGFAGVSIVFTRLYQHAATQHLVIGLSELELFDTRALERWWLAMTIRGLTLVAWSVVMISLRASPRDPIWRMVYLGGIGVVALMNLTQRRALKRLATARQALVAGTGSTPVALSDAPDVSVPQQILPLA